MRRAIVTGADSGIGKATAVALAKDGCDVGILYRGDEEGAKGAVEEIAALGRRAEMRQFDLSELPGCADAVEELARALGGVDVFVNNAGMGIDAPFLEHSWEDWKKVIDVNLNGAFVCGQRAAQLMVNQGKGGRIVNVTSVHEHVPLAESAAYCASKGGLGLLTKTMAYELAEHGITVNAVAPGETSTPMTNQHNVDPHQQKRPGIPMGRPADAREVAATIVHLCSDEARYVTGISVPVDGGLLLMAAMANRLNGGQ